MQKEQRRLAEMLGNKNIGFYSRDTTSANDEETKKDSEDFVDPDEEGKANSAQEQVKETKELDPNELIEV